MRACGLALFALVLAVTALPAAAEPVSKSPRPKPRPVASAPVTADPQTAATVVTAVPKPRPVDLAKPVVQAAVASAVVAVSSLRPRSRPDGLAKDQIEVAADSATDATAEPKKKPGREKKSAKGSVCGDPAIKGVKLARVKSKVKGCGVEDPVSVTSVDGIQLSQAATLDCPTAIALKTWVQQSMRPAFGNRDVVQLQIAAHYICRPRNNIKGNKISEHGRGKAIDISGFVFSDGKSWSILRDYNKQIRKAHKGACGLFGTTLGPGSDGYHEDHLHFDTASYRSGSYCR